MSRISQKSALSPSIAKGSNAIDLGKNSGVDMGRKSQPSITSGGLGITQEVTTVGGISVNAGVSADISPLDFGININPSEGTANFTAGAEIPGGILGIGGGVTVDTNTGEVIGGVIGAEVAGFGINVSGSEGGLGVEFTLQIPGTPIELSLGFGFPPPKKSEKPKPTPQNPGIGYSPESLPPLDNDCVYHFLILIRNYKQEWFKLIDPSYLAEGLWEKREVTYGQGSAFIQKVVYDVDLRQHKLIIGLPSNMVNVGGGYSYYYDLPHYKREESYEVRGNICTPSVFQYYLATFYKPRWPAGGFSIIPKPLYCYGKPLPPEDDFGNNSPSPSPSPFPNPPPRRIMDECCRDTLKLLRQIKKLNVETIRQLGRQVSPEGDLMPIVNTPGLLGEKIKRIETPILDGKKPKEIEISFPTIYQLLTYCLRQANDLDVALDPKSFKIPNGYIQNPNYNRDSEHSLKYNDQPNRDKTGEKREFEINEDEEAKMGGFLEQQKYVFEAMKRLEYLFPSGEFKDFKIDKALIAPGKTGDMQVHNHFQTLEVLFQYLNSSLGNPREPIHVADTNPGKEGSQPITITPFSLSHLMRETFKYVIDMEGDQDSQLNLEVRNFRTSLANRIQIIQIAEMVKALYEDTGMLEKQEYIKVKLEGDPYAGCHQEGKGFEPKKELDENTEEATEKLLAATLRNFKMKIKVSRRDNKKDPNDLRDVIIELYNKLTEQQGGRAIDVNLVEQELAKAEFNVALDSALARANVKRSQAASTYRTRKKKK